MLLSNDLLSWYASIAVRKGLVMQRTRGRTHIKHEESVDTISVPEKYESILREMAYTFSRASSDHVRNTNVEVPSEIAILLSRILQHISKSGTYSIVPLERKVSTFQAAVILGVSRPFLIKSILDKGLVPYERVGQRGDRRIKIEDLMNFRHMRAATRREALDELSRMNAEFVITGLEPDEDE